MRRDRPTLVVYVVLLGFGLLTAAYAIWVQGTQIRANQSLIRQQQQTVDALLRQNVEDKQALEAQQRLVRGLQAQVQKLGGTPLLTAPAAPATPRPAGPTGAGPSTTQRSAAPHPRSTTRPTTRPTGSPSQSPTPKPSPTPSPKPSPTPCVVKLGPICL